MLHYVRMATARAEPRPLDSVGLPCDDDLALAARGNLAHQRLKLDALFGIGPSQCRLYPLELPEIQRPRLLRSTDYLAIRLEHNVNFGRFHTQVELRQKIGSKARIRDHRLSIRFFSFCDRQPICARSSQHRHQQVV